MNRDVMMTTMHIVLVPWGFCLYVNVHTNKEGIELENNMDVPTLRRGVEKASLWRYY